MFPLRFRLVLLAGVALGGAATAQVAKTPFEQLLDPYKKTGAFTAESSEMLQNLKEGLAQFADNKGVPNPKARKAVEEKAQEIVYKVTWPEYHETVKKGIDGKIDDTLRPRDPNKTVDQIMVEIRREFISNAVDGKLNPAQLEYHREYGAALFDAILTVMTDKNPPPVLRLNAARLLPVAAETASPAVGRGLLKLLGPGVFRDADKKPVAAPPDVLLYALKACETFFDRYNVPKPGVKDLRTEEYAGLISAVIKIVESGPPVLDKVAKPSPGTDPKTAAAAVVRFYRLQAVRALGKLKADTYGEGADLVRPLFTLAKVAVSDPAIQPAPSPKEVGEATLGLTVAQLGPDANADELAFVVAEGAAAFFAARAEVDSADAKAVDWKAAAAQYSAAVKAWQTAAGKNRNVTPAGVKAVGEVAVKLETEVLAPLLKPSLDSSPNVNALREWQDQARGRMPGALFNDPANKAKYKMNYPKR